MKPRASVIIVSDYVGTENSEWQDIKLILAALARQDFEDNVEFLLCESADRAQKIPEDLIALLPSLKIIVCRSSSSFEMKNEGVRAASADIVALIDADCIPAPDWLRAFVQVMEGDPKAVTVSGRTLYAGHTLSERVLGLLGRSYLDPGRAKETRFISNNNAGYRRAVYLSHPLPTDAGPFASRLQSESILRAGGKLLFEPTMRVIHSFEGWEMEKDIRRNIGYGTIITRLRDRRLPYAWLTHLGTASIPFFYLGKTLDSWADCIRGFRYYGVRWYELPVAFLFAIAVNFLEIPGMIRALRKQNLVETAYR